MQSLRISTVVVFIWIGMVCAISFMEAWIKFKAPGITVPLGLGIGRLVFKALNIVEITFALVIISQIFLSKSKYLFKNFSLITVLLILIIQSFYMLPKLDERALMYISGTIPPASNLHFSYIISEAVKVIALFIFGNHLLNQINYGIKS